MRPAKAIIGECPDSELRAAVREILAWQSTSRLEGTVVRSLAQRLAREASNNIDPLQAAETLVLREAAIRWSNYEGCSL